MFGLFTAYESSKYGVGCWKVTAMMRGKVVGKPLVVERRSRGHRASSAATSRRRLEPVRRGEPEVALDVVHRIADRRRLVVARQQYGGAEVDRPAPELRERRTLDPEALDVLGIGAHDRWRDDVVGHELDDGLRHRVEMHLLRRAVDVPRRARPILSFPLVVVHPEHVAVGALELGVDVHEWLDPVVASGNVGHVEDGSAELLSIDDGARARREALDS